MKRVLSLVLALVMVLGMIPTFAAEMTGGEHLLEHGFITGKPGDDVATKLDAGAALTRQELAALIAELMGEKEIAAVFAQPADYADADKIGAWAVPFVAYAQVNGWMSGKPGNMFDPTGPVPGQQLAAVLMNALGYTVDTQAKYATVIADAAGLGLAVPSGNLTRGEAFTAMWTAVSAVKVNGEEVTLGVKLGKLTPPAPVVVDLMIESVVANNLKEVVVKFNQPVDEDTVVADNFVLNKSLTSAPTLSADGKTVIVAVTPVATGQMANQTEYTLTVEKVKSESGKEIAKVVKTFTAFDATLPTVVGVTYTGPKNFEIEFSEPMETYPTVTVKSGNSTLSVNTGGMTGVGTNVITVPLFSTLTDATTYTITVTGATDFAGYVNVIKSIDALYTKDVTAPTASVVKATQEYVLVEFSKPVSGLHHGLFSHTFSAWKASKLTATDSYASAAVTSGTKFYVWFNGAADPAIDRPIAQGTTTLNILPKQTTPVAAEILDLWGNKFVEATFPLTVVADTVAPEVKEIKITTESQLTVEFTKNVTFAAANIEILDKDGKAITGVSPSVVEASGVKKYTVNFGKNLAGETIIVNIKNVKDTTLMTNAMAAYTTTLAVTDKTAPTIEKVTYDATDKYLYVFFSENMDSASTLVKDNFQLVNGVTYTKLATDPVFVNGSKTVRFTLNTAQQALINLNATTVLVDNVKDVALNTITAKMSSPIVAHAGAVVPTFTKAEATATNKVVVTFDSELALIDIAAFVIDGFAPVAMDVAVVDGKTVATFTLNDANELAGNYANNSITVDFAGANQAAKEASAALIKNLFNVSPAWNDTVNVADKIAPTVLAANIVHTNGKITLTFSENLNTDIAASYAQDLVITKNGVAMVAGVDFVTTAAGAVITVSKPAGADLDDAVYSVKSVAAPAFIRDTQANKAAAFTTAKEVKVDKVLAAAKAALTLSVTNPVAATSTVTLPATQGGAAVAYVVTSGGGSIAAGTYTTPARTATSQTVVITATLTVGAISDTQTFTVTVGNNAETVPGTFDNATTIVKN